MILLIMRNNEPDGYNGQMVNLNEFLKKRDTFQANIAQLAQQRIDFTKENTISSEDFVVRLAEFSLGIAAAIVPVVIITDNVILRPAYIFSAILLYLVVGFYGMFTRKSRLESESTGLASFGYEHETQVRELLFLSNKVIQDPQNIGYIDDYYAAEKAYLESPSVTMMPSRVGHTLDIVMGSFILSTIVLAGAVWPFGWESHSLVLVAFIVGYLLYIIIDSQEAMRRIEQGRSLRQTLIDKSNEHYGWYIREKLKK